MLPLHNPAYVARSPRSSPHALHLAAYCRGGPSFSTCVQILSCSRLGARAAPTRARSTCGSPAPPWRPAPRKSSRRPRDRAPPRAARSMACSNVAASFCGSSVKRALAPGPLAPPRRSALCCVHDDAAAVRPPHRACPGRPRGRPAAAPRRALRLGGSGRASSRQRRRHRNPPRESESPPRRRAPAANRPRARERTRGAISCASIAPRRWSDGRWPGTAVRSSRRARSRPPASGRPRSPSTSISRPRSTAPRSDSGGGSRAFRRGREMTDREVVFRKLTSLREHVAPIRSRRRLQRT